MTTLLIPTVKYKRDLKRIAKRGYDLRLLDEAVDCLASGNPMPPNYQLHELSGNRKGIFDIHIKPDWLLFFEPDEYEGQQVIYLRRTGTHADLLE
jgi:mRNA interferase YafQ